MSSTFKYKGEQGLVAMMQMNEMIIEVYQMPEMELAAMGSRGNRHFGKMVAGSLIYPVRIESGWNSIKF